MTVTGAGLVGGRHVRMREEDDAEDVEECCHCTHFQAQVWFLLWKWRFCGGSDGRGLNVGQTAQVSSIEWYGTRQLSSAALLIYTTTLQPLRVRDLIFLLLTYACRTHFVVECLNT